MVSALMIILNRMEQNVFTFYRSFLVQACGTNYPKTISKH